MSKYKKTLKCKNPHNQFIIEHLQMMKMRCLQTGQEKVAFTYQKIIYAVSKYPLPILIQDQLNQIAGIGEKTSATLMKLISANYKDQQLFSVEMNEAILKEQQNDEEFELIVDTDGIASSSCPPHLNYFNPSSEEQKEVSINFKTYTNNNNFIHNMNLHMIQQKKIKETPNESKRPFVPSKNSKGWAILVGLHKYRQDTERIYASKNQIKQFAKQYLYIDKILSFRFQIDINNWGSLETLEKHNLIMKQTIFENECKWALTDEGEKMADQMYTEQQLSSKYIPLETIEEIDFNKAEIILLVDNRERFQQQQRSLIYDKLSSIYNIKCKLTNLPLGDFLWVAKLEDEEYICDYIVERKTISDLASSILDKRYNEQKRKLKQCEIKNLFYLIENCQTQNLPINRTILEKAIRSTQIRDGFNIQQTQNLDESLLWLTNFTKMQPQVKKPLLSYKQWVENNSMKSTTILNQWGSMLRSINGIGLEAARLITSQWDTPIKCFDQINKPEGLQQLSIEDIIQKSKKRINQSTLKTLEILFTQEEYPEAEWAQ